MCFHVTSVYTWYIHVYTRHILLYATVLHVPLVFSGFHGTHRPPAQLSCSCRKKHTMTLILISQIHKQCWRDSCPMCLLAMMNRENLHLHNLVRFHLNRYAYHILCICLVYEMYLHCVSYVYVNDILCIYRV